MDITPIHDFPCAIDEHIVYLDDILAEKVLRYRGELLMFWNDTVGGDKIGSHQIRQKLDYEIPAYLPRLRRDINQSLDPNYAAADDASDTPILRHMETGKQA